MTNIDSVLKSRGITLPTKIHTVKSMIFPVIMYRCETDAEALILWPPDVKSRLIAKDPDARKDWGQEAKRATEDEMIGWHHWLNGCEFEQTPGDSEGQGRLVGCSQWDCKESDKTERLTNNKDIYRGRGNSLNRMTWCVCLWGGRNKCICFSENMKEVRVALCTTLIMSHW